MKIGIICEGENTDAPVIKLILEHHFHEQIRNNRVQFQIKGVDKGTIFSAGDVLLKEMFDGGATRALIVWDLLPPGHQMGISSQYSEKPNREEQRRVLLETICTSPHLQPHVSEYAIKLWHGYGFDGRKEPINQQTEYFRLVCICFTLETWLITDPSLLSKLASTDSHRAPAFPSLDLNQCRNPLGQITRHFGQGPNRRLKYYNKIQHNLVLTRAYLENGSLKRMRECDSFCRVIDTIEGWLGT